MMLNPMVPEEVAVKSIPRQAWYSISELYRFRNFQGIALARKLHVMAQVLNILFWIVVLLSTFDDGPEVVIAGLILCPVLLIVYACVIRLVCEMVVAVLLIPFLLAKNDPLHPAGGQVVDDSDLAAYGVSNGSHDMGATV